MLKANSKTKSPENIVTEYFCNISKMIFLIFFVISLAVPGRVGLRWKQQIHLFAQKTFLY